MMGLQLGIRVGVWLECEELLLLLLLLFSLLGWGHRGQHSSGIITAANGA